MSHRALLKLGQVRRIFRLIGEIRAVGSDPQLWRPKLLDGLRSIIPADLIISSEVHFRTTASENVLRVFDIGWGSDFSEAPWRIHTERDGDPESYLLHTVSHRPKSTDAVVPVVPTSPMRGGHSLILSQIPLPHLGAVDQLGLHRVDIHQAFTPTEHRLVRLFHVELGRLWKSDAIEKAQDPQLDLPPRLQQTLDELLSGKSEKEIASALDLSRHTVHNYVKALHSRLGVSSRGELMAKVGANRDQSFIPKLSVKIAKDLPKSQRPSEAM